MQTSRTFEPLVTSAGDVRRFVDATLAEWEIEDSLVAFLANELATNAILHARTPFEVKLTRNGSHCRIEVTDANPRLPVLQPVPAEAPSGHGMLIMHRHAESWGIEPVADGKTVWCEIPC